VITKTFVFRLDGVEKTHRKIYTEEPTTEQLIKDIQEWFFGQHFMWFAVKKDNVETNLEDLDW
jgi:hypothetical protein